MYALSVPAEGLLAHCGAMLVQVTYGCSWSFNKNLMQHCPDFSSLIETAG